MLRMKDILDRSTIGMKGYAKLLDMSEKSLYNKLTGATDFTLSEYRKLKSIFPEYDVLYLLSEDVSSA